MSPDLRLATVYMMPLGGTDENAVLEALERNKRYLRGEVAHRVNLKFAPDIRFRIDERFDEAERIERLLRSPEVQRDLESGTMTNEPTMPPPPMTASKLTSLHDHAGSALTRRPRRLPPSGGADNSRAEAKREKHDVHGWVVLDKPVGMTSTHAVAVIKRLFTAKRAGHAGTLDPLASGCLPIALGEATKTVPFVMDGREGVLALPCAGARNATPTMPRAGRRDERRDRPAAEAIARRAPGFIGAIEQVPPRYSAIKIEGERAYDIARDGEEFELKPRTVEVNHLDIIEMPDADHSGLRGRMRQGNLCARARSRPRPAARLLRPRLGAAAHRGRPVCRNRHDFTGRPRIFVP